MTKLFCIHFTQTVLCILHNAIRIVSAKPRILHSPQGRMEG